MDNEQTIAVEQIVSGGNHLLDLINQVLELSQIERGDLPISLETMSLGSLVDECLNLVRTTATARGLVVIPPDGQQGSRLPVRADRIRLKQVLLNLLMNAVKYNTTGNQISLTFAFEREGYLRLVVTDDGPGIPASRQHEVFTSFNRLGMEAKGIEGTGIGLAISKELVHLMDGEIGFNSIEGKGASFWVDMPLNYDAEQQSI